MANVRIQQLPEDLAPISTDVVAVDSSLGGTTRRVPIPNLGELTRPFASQPEAEAGTNNTKTMTPLRAKQQTDARLSDVPTAEAGVNDERLITPETAKASAIANIKIYDKRFTLDNIPGIPTDGSASASTALSALQAEHAGSGFEFIVPTEGKILLDEDFVITKGQRLVGDFRPNDATGYGGDYTAMGHSIRLGSGATIRLDNGGVLEKLLIYREGLTFNVSQGDFSSWTGTGVTIAYGNDQVVRDCMVLGFETCVASLAARGQNGSGRVVLDRVYVDGKNGFRLVGSYDSAYFDRLRAFCFVTQGYAGTPAPGEGYDPRKDRRPGIGFQLLDRADGTKFGNVEFFGYAVGFDANVASWTGSSITVDYPTTTTYNVGGSGIIGARLRADTDPTGPRTVDYDPCQIANLQIWSTDVGLKIAGNADRVAQVGSLTVRNSWGDAIQIDGGGLISPNTTIGLCSGAPVRFLSAPNAKTLIRGQAMQFGAGRNSNNVPVVKAPAGANTNLIDVKLRSDQSLQAAYFDNHPSAPSVASADPLALPAFSGNDMEVFDVTGAVDFSAMYGLRPGIVTLRFGAALTVFAGAFTGGFRLPGGAASLAVAAGSILTVKYDATADRWVVLSYQA